MIFRAFSPSSSKAPLCRGISAVMGKEFAFPKKPGMPFYFCSAADGTNVVAAFEDAIAQATEYAANPPEDDFVDQVMNLLKEDTGLPAVSLSSEGSAGAMAGASSAGAAAAGDQQERPVSASDGQ